MWIASLEPDVIVYNAAISACEKGEQWQRALGLLSEMREADLQPNVISATTLRSARARRASSGSGLWCFSARCGERICSPTLPIYSAGVSACEKGDYCAGISACEKGEQWQRGLALLSEMWEAKLKPNVNSYNAGISACEKGVQWLRALALLSDMREAQLEPDVISYCAGISACEKGEQWQRALVLLSEMGEVELEPTIIYNVGISACEKGLQWQRAWALLSEMWKTKLVPDVISYSAGISACERSEKCEY
ncbi:unnamed protein product [Prorocentrum cordatum]|uniref:Pentacotripeptide-repeat region of PRORP domain-containing protein n=1 Tax=Prorocentrum cordatum TaxID=2364126 RepID=A0ABN9PVB4_9DINO|nr:unnamed protein product [Polarella glacialis]